jgi:hypothetical protein
MMGHHSRAESLFYYFRLEDHIPENHLLRLIDRHINLEFIRAKLQDSYSDTGRPSIDPELLLRMLLIGYLYGVTSERKLGGRATNASGVAFVHGTGLRPGDSAPRYVFQEPAWTIPGIELVARAL